MARDEDLERPFVLRTQIAPKLIVFFGGALTVQEGITDTAEDTDPKKRKIGRLIPMPEYDAAIASGLPGSYAATIQPIEGRYLVTS